jgi:Uncharacterized conserved protein
MMHIFVYGTLKEDGPNHFLMRGENNKFVGKARTVNPVFDLLSLGKFPALVEGDRRVVGELYEIDPYTEARIDRLEQGLYNKVLTPIEVISADEYVYLSVTYMWDHASPFNPQHGDSRIMYNADLNEVMWCNDSYQID